MLIRQLVFVALCLPVPARAQFGLTATQVGFGAEHDRAAYDGICGRDACRAVLPVRLENDVCVLNIRVSAPGKDRRGAIIPAAGPCRSGLKLVVPAIAASRGYALEPFLAASQSFAIPFRLSDGGYDNPLMDDAVVHVSPTLRMDIIADKWR